MNAPVRIWAWNDNDGRPWWRASEMPSATLYILATEVDRLIAEAVAKERARCAGLADRWSIEAAEDIREGETK